MVRYEDDLSDWHERLVVQRVFNDGGWIIYTPHGDLYFEGCDYWADAMEREGPRYYRVPARFSESGDCLVSFVERFGRIAFDALAIDAREAARQECDAHSERAPAEVAERINNWNRSFRNAPGLVEAAAGRLWRMVGGVPGRGLPEGGRWPDVARSSGRELAVEPGRIRGRGS